MIRGRPIGRAKWSRVRYCDRSSYSGNDPITHTHNHPKRILRYREKKFQIHDSIALRETKRSDDVSLIVRFAIIVACDWSKPFEESDSLASRCIDSQRYGEARVQWRVFRGVLRSLKKGSDEFSTAVIKSDRLRKDR